ncbi:MAG: carbohydrate binding family 9 domain-containing protein [Gemmatimonadota bacterium]
MRLLLALFALLLTVTRLPAQQIYNGRARELNVSVPRIDTETMLDGSLADSAWRAAAVLTGFSQYRPVDGRPAEDSTQVLVWYDSHAIYFGIRAFEEHGEVSATLADRDKIDGEEYVQILLDPFNDRRRAWIFGVNPLGVQADGIRTEGAPGAASGPGAGGRFENVDLNPDFVFSSKGRVTDFGYEVEIRVPFKSIRYQSVDPQNWALNVMRKVQHSGYENTWTPARRANASFLAQSGELRGLTQLRRGLVS